ncbi:hypothetical protein AK812_SmicGene12332 [Symbiodinium microadriaticum]|uniref:Uncharacterized protein n=1 Tax=Symbiodinium microadriaticum TaxID=2951 RepID=A0A1Q9EAY3_SYMMI|nr:hypothetical protein AK812_SmicGene12332 [Symbiodinium microadriaticum]
MIIAIIFIAISSNIKPIRIAILILMLVVVTVITSFVVAQAEEEDWSDDATWTERFGQAQSTARLSSYSSINQDQETSLRDTRRPYPEEPRAGIVEPGATSGRWRRASQAVEALLALDGDLQPGQRTYTQAPNSE